MLIVRSTFAKILPESMHSRWDTWASVWLPSPALPTIVASVGATLITSAKAPGLQAALCCAGLLGVHASMIAWNKSNRKAWVLPQQEWKDACTKVEEKIRGIVHMPHLYRMGALCDLSSVLKDIEMERLVAVVKQLKGLGLQSDDIVPTAWMDGYTNGNMSAMMLTPEKLCDVHKALEFTKQDIEQWVEASYIQRIHSDLSNPMPGTVNALAKMANDNPAAMAFYLQKHPSYTDRKKIYDSSFAVQWSNDEASGLFKKTQWPQLVELMHDLHAQTSTGQTPVPCALDLYREVMAAKQAPALPGIDGNVFEMDMPGSRSP